jgi:hypothetical protein
MFTADVVEKLEKLPNKFFRFTGVEVGAFQMFAKAVEDLWANDVTAKYKRPGRNCSMAIKQQMLAMLIYYRFCVPMAVIAVVFGVTAATICRHIGRIEPIFKKVVHIEKSRHLALQELKDLIAELDDLTEQ